MRFALDCLAVFLVTLAAAWCWPVYIRACNDRKPFRAALADCALIALGMVSVVGYTTDHRLALPILAAAFLGTFFVVKR